MHYCSVLFSNTSSQLMPHQIAIQELFSCVHCSLTSCVNISQCKELPCIIYLSWFLNVFLDKLIRKCGQIKEMNRWKITWIILTRKTSCNGQKILECSQLKILSIFLSNTWTPKDKVCAHSYSILLALGAKATALFLVFKTKFSLIVQQKKKLLPLFIFSQSIIILFH